ncbi:hypothetical protein AB0D27_17855 [Streptomyces sp. NPDC048415]|uniref:hypothetical protein n=1 Tax=Streptomyces sp. NPDC048415 TaxID=3154822 RepID=UPI003429DB56
MKIASRRTPFGDRFCFAEVVPHRLIDIQAAFVRRLETQGVDRYDALARSRLDIPGDLPALLQADPQVTAVRRAFDWAVEQAGTGVLHEDCPGPTSRKARAAGRAPAHRLVLARRLRPPTAVPGQEPPRRRLQGCLKAPSALAGPARQPAPQPQSDPVGT